MQQELRQLLSIDHERRVNKRQVVVWLDGHAPVVELATILFMPMAENPASKAGSLIQFMFLKIPTKVRLILPNNRIPHFIARCCQIPPVIDKINPACLQRSVPLFLWGEVPRVRPWIRNTTDIDK
jgi:hypothetical protein